MTARARLTAMTLALLILATPAIAETLTMTLDNVSVNTCDTAWTEGSCEMRVVDTITGDYTPPGNCIWFAQAEGLALMGARLLIDVSALDGITWLEVDVREVSGVGRTRLFVYEEGETTNYYNFAMSSYDGSATEQTMMLDVAFPPLGTIAISAHEALITEVRVMGNSLVDLEKTSWGTIKSRW